jgi:hypothetical protein
MELESQGLKRGEAVRYALERASAGFMTKSRVKRLVHGWYEAAGPMTRSEVSALVVGAERFIVAARNLELALKGRQNVAYMPFQVDIPGFLPRDAAVGERL